MYLACPFTCLLILTGVIDQSATIGYVYKTRRATGRRMSRVTVIPRLFMGFCHFFSWVLHDTSGLSLLLLILGQDFITASTRVARGMAKKTPQNPQIPPKINTAVMMATG